MSTEVFTFLMEIVGTVAFAAMGTMTGIRNSMDLFGIIVMAIITALGGGIMRDIVLGIVPPSAFTDPVYAIIAALTAAALFLLMYFFRNITRGPMRLYYDRTITIMDAIGLGTFTVVGIQVAVNVGYGDYTFLLLFVGVVTGVGGGVLRDMISMHVPAIFSRNIYASASLLGALLCVALMRYNMNLAMGLGALTIILFRMLAYHYKWNLPKIPLERKDGHDI